MKSPIGTLKLNTEKINELFGLSAADSFQFDSRTLGKYFTVFRDRFRGKRPLKLELSFGRPEILFGHKRTNVSVTYMVGISISQDIHDSKELLYDEFKLTTDLSVSTQNDALNAYITRHRVIFQNKYSEKEGPIRDELGFTPNEYNQFEVEFSSI